MTEDRTLSEELHNLADDAPHGGKPDAQTVEIKTVPAQRPAGKTGRVKNAKRTPPAPRTPAPPAPEPPAPPQPEPRPAPLPEPARKTESGQPDADPYAPAMFDERPIRIVWLLAALLVIAAGIICAVVPGLPVSSTVLAIIVTLAAAAIMVAMSLHVRTLLVADAIEQAYHIQLVRTTYGQTSGIIEYTRNSDPTVHTGNVRIRDGKAWVLSDGRLTRHAD